MTPSQKLSPWLSRLLVIALAIGIFFRCYHIDHKIYWNDEAFTSLRIAGYTRTEFRDSVAERLLSVDELLHYQQINDNKNLLDSIQSLSAESSHPPLYFVIAQLWAQVFGSQVTAIRALSVVASLLMLPTLYWLAWELFRCRMTAAISTLLMSVSPVFVLYAQEARSYAMWTLLVMVSHIALLRALKSPTLRRWSLYGVSVFCSLSVHFLAIAVVFAQGLFVLARENFRWTKIGRQYLCSGIAILLTYGVWLVFTFNIGQSARFTGNTIPLWAIAQRWLINLSSIFFDVQIDYVRPLTPLFDIYEGNDLRLSWLKLGTYLCIALVMLIITALISVIKQAERPVWLFILCTLFISTAAFVVPDVLFGGQRSTISRFMLPSYVSIQLAVAYFFTTQLTHPRRSPWVYRAWQGVLVAVLGLGVLSCSISASAPTWWHRYSGFYEAEITEIVNQESHPLFMSGSRMNLLAIAHGFDPKVNVWLMEGDDPIIPTAEGPIFLYKPSGELRKKIKQSRRYRIEPLLPVAEFGQLVPIKTLPPSTQ